ncbi:sensor histidine kinase [Radiobacillus sp. PE A8.2]|uniref:sensor histidine kinase n=1 Tax=Radiobacillus sp. PE A8.2 TaxID=3380349 RepID=UPI00388E74D8
MMIVLGIVGVSTFNRVSMLIKNNAERQIQQVATEANGRIETLYEHIDTVTRQIATNAEVQQLLQQELNGTPATFKQRQALNNVVSTIQANANGITSVEIYAKNTRRILPLDDTNLINLIEEKWINRADVQKGSLVWIGTDPMNSNYFLAIRRVSLMNQSFTNGGYLLIRISKNYFQLNTTAFSEQEYMIVVDAYSNPIISNYQKDISSLFGNDDNTVKINNTDYIYNERISDITGWTLVILTPVDALMEGISTLRTVIVISGIIGIFIFVICSIFLSTIITRPIIKLTETMRKAGEGSLTLNPATTSTNEINELNSTYNMLVKETNHLIQMVYEKELTRSRTELKALQAQINPHFLFNTLDALYWSLIDKEEDELAEYVVAMSELFRYTITNKHIGEWVTIKEEMEHIKRYMQIMQMRFGDRLHLHISVPQVWENNRIPKLLIQPLVENAILHGAGNKTGDCIVSIVIEASMHPSRLIVKVEDDGAGMDQERVAKLRNYLEEDGVSSLKGNGIAIINVNKRLHLYYEDNLAGLAINSELGMGTSITFEIPIQGGIQ